MRVFSSLSAGFGSSAPVTARRRDSQKRGSDVFLSSAPISAKKCKGLPKNQDSSVAPPMPKEGTSKEAQTTSPDIAVAGHSGTK